MECPKCNGEFEKIIFSGIEIERCNTCQGLWFDLLEKEDLVKIEGSESIDIGNEQMGKRYSSMRDIECPHCGDSMIAMVDKDQFHINYESCPSCFGTFFDAGEYKDLKEHSVVERFLQMLETLRRNL